MSSLTSTPSELLQFSLNDSTLDLLNAAIISHQVRLEDKEVYEPVQVHTKRGLDSDDQASVVPKRVGRKPLDKSQLPDGPLDPKQKRKAQNRAAQRAFRDRKEKHVAELQARIDELEKLNASKDQSLLEENRNLKGMLQKLQEENHALKGTQFTFEFPLTDSTTVSHEPLRLSSTSPLGDFSQYHAGSSFSEDASSSTEQSPLSHPNTNEDDTDTPLTNNMSFSADPTQFGLLQPQNTHPLDFLAVTDANLATDSNLFHGKDDLFNNYQPSNDDFLFANEDLSSLFGAADNLFGFNQTSSGLSFNAQFGLPETPATRRLIPQEKKEIMLKKLKQAQQEGKYVYQGYQDMNASYPDFNLDVLCDELRDKAKCSLSTYPITDREVDAFMKCLEKN